MRYNIRNPFARYIVFSRCDMEQGDFGWRAKYACNHCDWHGDREPEIECTYFSSRAFNSYRLDPDEYEWRCPSCGNHDVEEMTSWKPFKLIKRYKKEMK